MLAALMLASCMDSGYDIPVEDNTGTRFELNNVMSIQDLKDKYRTTINGNGFKQITEDIQVKGIVTGNDEGSNLYNQISLQDKSGAIIVAVSQRGLYGFLPVGAEIAINLKGLYIGGYGNQAEIGGVYTNAKTGANGIGGMDRYLLSNHYMVINRGNASKASELIENFDYSKATDNDYIWKNQGKLMRLAGTTASDESGISFKDGNGKSVFAPKNDPSVRLTNNCANRAFNGMSSRNIVFRTSTYAKFAADTIPQGKTKVIGIFTVYRSTWQILARDRNDAFGIE